MHFLDFDLIRQPIAPRGAGVAALASDLLVLYLAGDERRDFLLGILKAAGFAEAKQEVHLLPLEPEMISLDLSTLLLRQPNIKRILIFGIDARKLGLHFQIVNYAPVTVNGHTYLLADDLQVISSEKNNGNTQKAGALWRAVKANFTNT